MLSLKRLNDILITNSFMARAFGGFITMLYLRVIKPAFTLCEDCYNGSAFLDAVGRASENHRWIG